MTAIPERLAHWNTDEGRPYKGQLIDYDAWKENPSIGCMCAQGQVLHLLGGWSPDKLRDANQEKADKATAKLLNISIAHSVLLRLVNDKRDGAPSIVLTSPEKVLGDQARVVLAFWLHMDGMTTKDWDAARDAAQDAAQDAAWDAARAASRDAAWVAAQDAARATAQAAERAAALVAAAERAASRAAERAATQAASRAATQAASRAATQAAERATAQAAARAVAWASNEIQGARIMRERGKPFFFLPMFGFADPESIPPIPADYGCAQ